MLLVTPFAAATEIYRWTDAEGRVHFGDRPPQSGAERLQVAPSPAADSEVHTRHERTQRLLDAFAEDRAERRERRAEEAATKAEQKRRCAAARDNRRRFEQASRVVRRDAAGNRIVLEGDAYAQAHRRLEEAVEQWCGSR